MTALGSIGPVPYRTIFDQTHGSGSDPLQFALGPGPSIPSYQDNFRAPYLSPPMSGSPSPESRSGPIRGTRRRQRSSSPYSPTTAGPTTIESGSRHGAHNSISSINLVLNHEATQPPQNQVSTASSTATGFPAQENPTSLGTASLPPGTGPLPPRLTRRTKAHVASACVNCKQKHLGCDSARPCRRCVLAGKEVCVYQTKS